MPLQPGDKLGPYEILVQIGEGGMGEVYRARDPRLNRDVAIKVSTTQFSERFEREAKAVAALNHPNICSVYDVGPNYIVMEYIEGEAPQGPLPLEEALRIARQICEALEAAHEKGVTHRDLKPANIKIKPDGAVKVLDFGLAKVDAVSGVSQSENSPTLSMAATQMGVILGTAGYMSPEQARGKSVDKRADIWAFGVVLYELLMGKRLFQGEDVSHTMAAVIMQEPNLAGVPVEMRRLLKKCLEKDPKKRLRDIGDVWELLDAPPSQSGTANPAQTASLPPSSKLPWITAAVASAAAVTLGLWSFSPRPAPPRPEPVRFTISPAKGSNLTTNGASGITQAVSPDGRYIAYLASVSAAGSTRSLWVRALGSQTAQQLDKTENAIDPFWSPDSKHIAFLADGKLKRIAVAGGSPINICDTQSLEGGAWLQQAGADGETDGVILFAPNNISGLLRVPASGGVPTPATKLAEGETGHSYPQFLPGGKRFQFFVRGGPKPGIYVQTLGSADQIGEKTFLLATPGRASFAPPDYLLFMRDNTLLAQHFNWDALKALGEPLSVTDEVRNDASSGRNSFSVSTTGVLAYRAGTGAQFQYRWYTRDGKPEGSGLPTADYSELALAPDDKKAVVRRSGDLWLVEFPSGVLSRLTSDMGEKIGPAWSPDSRRIAFKKNGDKPGIYQMLIGSGKDTLIYSGADKLEAWTPEGLLLLSGGTLSLIPAPKEDATGPVTEKPRTLLDVKYKVDQFRVSPDGKWVAYMSQEGGIEVWVARFPGFTDRRKISTGNARAPLWRADGKEIIFDAQPNIFTSVDVKTGPTFEASLPKQLFRMPNGSGSATAYLFAITSDAKRFLARSIGDSDATEAEALQLIVNWPALLGK
jgi:eukaryotic-like serine/threonine-protein kinase